MGFLITTNAAMAAIAATTAAVMNARWKPLFSASIEPIPLLLLSDSVYAEAIATKIAKPSADPT